MICELFYNFMIAGRNRGFSYLNVTDANLLSHTEFEMEPNNIYRNIFHLKLKNGRVVESKHGEDDWVNLSDQPPNHFPGCAYPLLLPRVNDKAFRYTQISEDSGAVIGEFVLSRIDDEIVELNDDKIYRRFRMSNDVPTSIDWGGAVSHLCGSPKESVAGSPITFSLNSNDNV